MAKILKHFGLGNKKSSSSPVHKCKIEAESPKISAKSNNKYPNQDSTTKDDDSTNSPTSPIKSPSESLGKMSSGTPDKSKNGLDLSRLAYEDPNIPVYSAVIKETKITPDSILNEIASKLNVTDEKSNEPMSTFGKSSNSRVEDASDKKSTTAEKLPDVIKAESDSDCWPTEYDDPYEEGPVRLSQQQVMPKQIDSGVSSTKSSTTTLNMVHDSDDTLEKPKKQTTCTGETQIGFDTLRSWNIDNKTKRQNIDGLSINENNDEDGADYDNDTLEGKDIEPPPIPAKTYNLANELPPPPPNLLENGGDFDSVSRPPIPARMSMSIQPEHDQPLDLSGGKIMNSRGNKSDTWCGGRRYDEDNIPIPCGPAPEPPMRDHYRDAPRGSVSSDVRPRHDSLMMRSAYGIEQCSNYPPNQYYYPAPQQPPTHMPTQQVPVRHHYRSGSVRSVDYRPGLDYDEPWDQQQQQQQAFTWQTAPDNMRCSYNVVPRHPQYNSRTSLTSASWGGPNYPGEPIDPRIPLEEQFWFHGTISRVDTENVLRLHREGSYLVRMSESNRFDFSLSVKSSRGFMHMKITTNPDGRYILGQFSQPFTSIPHMIQHYTIHKLPIKGAEHMSLLYPVGNDML